MTASLPPWMTLVLITLIVLLGATALAFFYFTGGKPGGGVSKLNIRAVGIVFVVVAAAILAVVYESAVVAAVGLLGAVAGYLFGASAGGGSDSEVTTGDVLGDNARIAGRDLVEKLESLSTTVENYSQTLAGAGEAGNHGYHVHEERFSRAGDWPYTLGATSDLALAHVRAVERFPRPDFQLITASAMEVSDFIHVVFVFGATAYVPSETRRSLASDALMDRRPPTGLGR